MSLGSTSEDMITWPYFRYLHHAVDKTSGSFSLRTVALSYIRQVVQNLLIYGHFGSHSAISTEWSCPQQYCRSTAVQLQSTAVQLQSTAVQLQSTAVRWQSWVHDFQIPLAAAAGVHFSCLQIVTNWIVTNRYQSLQHIIASGPQHISHRSISLFRERSIIARPQHEHHISYSSVVYIFRPIMIPNLAVTTANRTAVDCNWLQSTAIGLQYCGSTAVNRSIPITVSEWEPKSL